MFINSGCLMGIAKRAYETAIAGVSSTRDHVSNDPIISIVFAAAAGEAFINEIGEIAGQRTFDGEDESQQCVCNLAKMLGEIEDSRGSTLLKYLVGMNTLSGKSFDKGGKPYQDFAILMDLRNSNMHLKFDRIVSVKTNYAQINHPSVLNKLQEKQILVKFESEKDVMASWFYKISTPAVAKWACNATSSIVNAIVEAVPTGEFREKADFFYSPQRIFAPIK